MTQATPPGYVKSSTGEIRPRISKGPINPRAKAVHRGRVGITPNGISRRNWRKVRAQRSWGRYMDWLSRQPKLNIFQRLARWVQARWNRVRIWMRSKRRRKAPAVKALSPEQMNELIQRTHAFDDTHIKPKVHKAHRRNKQAKRDALLEKESET